MVIFHVSVIRTIGRNRLRHADSGGLAEREKKELDWYRRECVFNYPDGSEAIREADENELWG